MGADEGREKIKTDFDNLVAEIRRMAAIWEQRHRSQYGGVDAELKHCEIDAKAEAERNTDLPWQQIQWFKVQELRATYRRRLAMAQFEDVEGGHAPSKTLRARRDNGEDVGRLIVDIKEAIENCETTLRDILNHSAGRNSTLVYPRPGASQRQVQEELAELDNLKNELAGQKP